MAIRSIGFEADALISDIGQLRAKGFEAEVIVTEGGGLLYSRTFSAEVLQRVPPGASMTTILFPMSSLTGLTFDVVKRPRFSTKISESSGGNETRSPFYEFPRWDFELSFEYLPDLPVEVGQTQLKTLLSFFLARRGSYDFFLFKDPDDYQVVDGVLGTTDGTTLQWPLVRTLGLDEPVGQVAYTDYYELTPAMKDGDNLAVPAPQNTFTSGDGPYYIRTEGLPPSPLRTDTAYWMTASPAADPQQVGFCTTKANAIAGTYIPLLTAGTKNYTLYRPDVVVKLDGVEVSQDDYYILMPNQVVFYSAPTAGQVLTATFNFYFRVRFLEDTADFNKFADKLWELQKCNFRSEIPSE